VNVFALGLGLACFVAAYATVVYWSGAERHFAAADRTYAITANLALRDGSVATGMVPHMGDVVARYLKTDFPELEAVIRARSGNGNDASFTTGEKKARPARALRGLSCGEARRVQLQAAWVLPELRRAANDGDGRAAHR
jgi:hypothetical protein